MNISQAKKSVLHGQSIQKNRHKITLTIGLFFDGTGNNAINVTNMLEACKNADFDINSIESKSIFKRCAETKKNLTGYSASSYGSYYTNIYWLKNLYKTDCCRANDEAQSSIYIEGIGTEAGEPDSLQGLALGTSDTGVVAKTDVAIATLPTVIRQTIEMIKKSLQQNDFSIESVQFDIFGFSRGAAAARHFANRVLNQDSAIVAAIKTATGNIDYCGKPAGKTRFIGIFDTVTAIGELVNGFNPHSANTLDVNIQLPPGIAEKVFHITAQHECRFNFALNSVSPVWSELELPGSHSDIGGGYFPQEQEHVFLTRPLSERVVIQQPDADTGVYRKTLAQLGALESALALKPILQNTKVIAETWSRDCFQRDKYSNEQKYSFAALALGARTVKNDWSKISLRVMLRAAEKAGVLFRAIDDSDKTLLFNSELEPLLSKALVMAESVMQNQNYRGFAPEEVNLLGKDYLHSSANWNALIADAKGTIQSSTAVTEVIGFTDRPDENWQRTCYDMEGNKR